MALNETQKRNLDKLDLMGGTGIFTKNTKVDSVDLPTIIISLGGLGGKTLNALKGQIDRRVNSENNSIKLLAIDSSEADIKNLTDFGNLSKDETLSLYDNTIANYTKNIPPFIKEWLSEDFVPSVTGEGCGGCRQNGRYILSVENVYSKVRDRIKKTILSAREVAPNGKPNIIFIAGISGGTGSGTFIDIAYLTHDILKNEIGMSADDSYKISAYIYMPDVQFECGADTEALKRNGYAALKELDYFYNLKKVGGEYEWPFNDGGKRKNSNSNIYDFCTLISSFADGGVIVGNKETAAINVVVESLMAVITNAQLIGGDNQPEQILSSFLDNNATNIESWMMGADTITYPRSANYCYNVIGYGSARIPVDAIMSYIALKMYDNVLEEFYNMNDLTPEHISKIMTASNLKSVDDMLEVVKNEVGCKYRGEAPSGGDIHGLKQGYRTWKGRVIDHYQSFKNQQSFSNAVERTTKNIINSIDSRLKTYFGEKGPYFVSKMITGSAAAGETDGLLKKIDGLIAAVENEYSERKSKLASYESSLDSMAQAVPAFLGIVKEDERNHYVKKAYKEIEKYTIEMDILSAMQDKLGDIRNYLAEENHKIFDVYTNVLDYINELLKKNSDLVVKSNTVTGNNNITYSLDVVNLDTAQENGRKLKACLDSFLTPVFLEKFKEKFKEILRSEENRPAFTDTTDKFDAAKLIQGLFDDLLGKFYREAVERFLIAYYYTGSDMDNYEKLDSVMNNDADKNAALKTAAETICTELKHSAKPLCQIIDGSISNYATPKKYMCVPSVLYDTFKEVAVYFDDSNDIKLCRRDNAFSVDVVTNHIGIPLTKIYGINDADAAYDRAICSNVKGLHLDENPKSDFKMLPAPFIREAWGSVAGAHTCTTELNNIKAVEELTEKLKKYDLIQDDKDANNQSCNLRVKLYFSDNISKNEVAEIDNAAREDVTGDAIVNSDYIKNFLLSKNIAVSDLPIKIDETGLTSSMDNMNVIVRKNVVLYRKLKNFMDNYEKLNDIINVYKNKNANRDVFETEITNFSNLIRTGIVVYDPSRRRWNYNDGQLEKVLYNFAMKGPFERTYNLFFAFSEYYKFDAREKENLSANAYEKGEKGEIVFDMPESIMTDISVLYTGGTTEDTDEYRLDKELNRAKINQAASVYGKEFELLLSTEEDSFNALGKFYRTFQKNFK